MRNVVVLSAITVVFTFAGAQAFADDPGNTSGPASGYRSRTFHGRAKRQSAYSRRQLERCVWTKRDRRRGARH